MENRKARERERERERERCRGAVYARQTSAEECVSFFLFSMKF
jgi:hypothetical protein